MNAPTLPGALDGDGGRLLVALLVLVAVGLAVYLALLALLELRGDRQTGSLAAAHPATSLE